MTSYSNVQQLFILLTYLGTTYLWCCKLHSDISGHGLSDEGLLQAERVNDWGQGPPRSPGPSPGPSKKIGGFNVEKTNLSGIITIGLIFYRLASSKSKQAIRNIYGSNPWLVAEETRPRSGSRGQNPCQKSAVLKLKTIIWVVLYYSRPNLL